MDLTRACKSQHPTNHKKTKRPVLQHVLFQIAFCFYDKCHDKINLERKGLASPSRNSSSLRHVREGTKVPYLEQEQCLQANIFEYLVTREWHFERIKRYSLAVGSVSLGMDLGVPKSPFQTKRLSPFCLQFWNVELAATSPGPCLYTCCPTSHHNDNELNP